MNALVWFRRDLRVADNTALHHASDDGQRAVIGIFLLAPGQWLEHDDAPCKVDFWLRNLKELRTELGRLNIPLLVRPAERFHEAPQALLRAASEHGCELLHFNREYEVNEQARDRAVEEAFAERGLVARGFDDRVILEPGSVLTRKHEYYQVFTPYRNRWRDTVSERDVDPLPPPPRQEPAGIDSDRVPETVEAFAASEVDPTLWPAGEARAMERLEAFSGEKLERYGVDRDRYALDATSGLSPYLAAGVLSPRQCLEAALAENRGRLSSGREGPLAWMDELIWREFFQHVLVGFPRVSMHQPFRQESDLVAWNEDEEHFRAWCEARTGYPVVDAAMRQLVQVGWMHNRLRMIVAMFLSKHLLIDWRRGEKYFMRHLIDGDLGSNNGGWQWSASTGTDAAPYFRMFNPTKQSRRFDPEGEFLRRYLPELDRLGADSIHEPARLPEDDRKRLEYPDPIVDHQAARERVIERFEEARK